MIKFREKLKVNSILLSIMKKNLLKLIINKEGSSLLCRYKNNKMNKQNKKIKKMVKQLKQNLVKEKLMMIRVKKTNHQIKIKKIRRRWKFKKKRKKKNLKKPHLI